MQIMHKTTHDRHLTGVHWPIHRSRCRGNSNPQSPGSMHRGVGQGTERVVDIAMRSICSVITSPIHNPYA